MGGAFPRPEPEPVAPVGLEASGTPKELLEQLLHIELQCCPATAAARNWHKEPNAVDEEKEGTVREALEVQVLLDEPDIRFAVCYDDDSPVIIACLWSRLKGYSVEEVVTSLCEERGEWDKGGDSRLLRQTTLDDGSTEEVYHTLIRCPRPFWDREVLKQQWRLPLDCEHGKGCALVSRSMEDPDVPKDPERVRAFAHKAGALVRTVDFSMPIENCSVATELTTCSQIDMGGLIPAWATNYCRSIVVNKATAWTEDLRRHLVQRKLDVPSLAEISKDLLPQWTEHWDETEVFDEEDLEKEPSHYSMTSMPWGSFFSGDQSSSS